MSTKSQITIRLATSADIPALMHLERQSSSSAHWAEKQYQDCFSEDQKRVVVVATLGGEETVAFLVAHRVADEWELENIVVTPAERRKGIGIELVAALTEKTKSEAVFLEVRASNAAARALYESAGFRQTGVRKSYYQNPLEDAVLYRRKPG